MTGDLGSSFNPLSAGSCQFLVKAVLSALATWNQWLLNKGETFMSFLRKQLTALLPREDQNPSYRCFSFVFFLGMRQLTIPLPIQSTVFTVLLHCRLKSRCLLPGACLSWVLTQRQYQLAASLIGTLELCPVSTWKVFILRKKTATHYFSQSVISANTHYREWSQWAPPPYHRKTDSRCQGWGKYSLTKPVLFSLQFYFRQHRPSVFTKHHLKHNRLIWTIIFFLNNKRL